MFKFIVICMLWAILVMTTVNATCSAGAYIDFGTSYVGELSASERVSVDLGNGYTINATHEADLQVSEWALMLRTGYKWDSGFHLEYDVVGAPSTQLRRINFYHRYVFQ